MKTELGLTDTQCGLAQTSSSWAWRFSLFPWPTWWTAGAASKTIGIMALLWSVFTFLTGTARNFTTMIIPRSLVGLGESGFTAGGVAMISAAYTPEKTRRMLASSTLALPLGAAIGMMLGGAIYGPYRLALGLLPFCLPGAVLGILALFMRGL
jgi:MFS family permease